MHRDVYVAQLAALLEQLVDVNAYQVDGTHVWGFFRAAMYFPLVEAFGPDRVPAQLGEKLAAQFEAARMARGLPVASTNLTSSSTPASPGEAISPATGSQKGGVLETGACGTASAKTVAVDRHAGPVVVAASGPSHHRLKSGLYESPVADAWTRILIDEGHAVLRLDALPAWLTANQPRSYPSVGLPGITEAERRLAAEIVKQRWIPVIAAMFADINGVLQDAIGINLQSAVAACTERALAFVAEREAAGRWLDMVHPRAVMFVCYYETCYLSMISACRARGIPTVDLQHGMNGTVHAAYTHWTSLLASGYDVLPDWFLTWGDASSNNLRRWWSAPTRHRALVGGRRDIDVSAPLSDQAAVAMLAERAASAARCILITMQDEPLDTQLLEEMRTAPSDWLWLVRPHPSSVRYPEATAEAATQQLSAAGVTTALTVPLEVGTLADLLQLSDFHVTGTSSSWIDAWMYDVPTAFIHPGAGMVFATEIEEGLAYFVPNGTGVNAVIAAGASGLRTTATAVVERSPQVARDALATILGPSPRQAHATH